MYVYVLMQALTSGETGLSFAVWYSAGRLAAGACVLTILRRLQRQQTVNPKTSTLDPIPCMLVPKPFQRQVWKLTAIPANPKT